MEKKSIKSKIIKWVLLVIGLAITITAIVLDGKIYGESSIFNKPISENGVINALYQKIPALIRSVQIVVLAIVLQIVVSFLLMLTLKSSNRGITIAKLL